VSPAALSPIAAARARHPLASVAARTGIWLPARSGAVTVRCVLPAHGHPDRSPSLRLYLNDDRYFCFGCGSKGGVVQWARDLTGTDVAGAIKVLDSGAPLTPAWPPGLPPGPIDLARGGQAGRAGRPHTGAAVSPRAESPDLARTPPGRALAALAAAWDYCTRPPARDRAAAYLAARGVDVRLVEACTGRAEAGYAPARPDGLAAALTRRGFTADELVDAGLARRYPARAWLADFYRGRVLLPLRDDQGHVVGFAGRDVTGHGPKYLNPPATAVYDKSLILYRPLPAAPGGQVVVVEGTIDALAIAAAAIAAGQAGRFCPVTQSGRELSDAQLGWLARCGRPVVLGFDGDSAGMDSASRYVAEAARAGLPVHVTILPGGHDPASWLAGCGPGGLAAWDITSPPGTGPRPVPGLAWARSHAAAAGQRHPGPFAPARPGRATVDRNHPAAGTGTVPGGDLAVETPPAVSM
jgi:DNA primase